jgi:hypothetical protein
VVSPIGSKNTPMTPTVQPLKEAVWYRMSLARSTEINAAHRRGTATL